MSLDVMLTLNRIWCRSRCRTSPWNDFRTPPVLVRAPSRVVGFVVQALARSPRARQQVCCVLPRAVVLLWCSRRMDLDQAAPLISHDLDYYFAVLPASTSSNTMSTVSSAKVAGTASL